MRRLNSSGDPASLRETIAVATPARRARSRANASGLLDTTSTTCAGNRPLAERSRRFCNVVPLPLTRTARRSRSVDGFIGALSIAKCFSFEGIIEIRIEASYPEDNASNEVCGQEQQAPALILPNMNVLVVPAAIQASAVAAKDHVTERHGRCWAKQ